MMLSKMQIHKLVIMLTVFFILISAIGMLLFPSKMLGFVGISSNPETNFLLRTVAIALLALIPSAWSARHKSDSLVLRNALIGLAIYMFISSAVDFYAYVEGIVNSYSIPSIVLRVLLGGTILWLLARR